MLGEDFKRSKEKGVTLLEALVATAIVAIGFIAIFQMVNYSVISIDLSGERTKANYLTSMIAEDLIGDKNTEAKDGKKFKDFLLEKRDSDGNSWKMSSCTDGSSASGTYTNAWDNKTKRKWDNRFSKKRLKCRSSEDTKTLKVFDICTSKIAGVTCAYKNDENYFLSFTGNENMLIGKMQVNMNNGKKKKYLYFQID
tara:strand:- start:3807 stop:4397 length:591 start_codon:yes stop_codon:yes gene_type:complete